MGIPLHSHLEISSVDPPQRLDLLLAQPMALSILPLHALDECLELLRQIDVALVKQILAYFLGAGFVCWIVPT